MCLWPITTSVFLPTATKHFDRAAFTAKEKMKQSDFIFKCFKEPNVIQHHNLKDNLTDLISVASTMSRHNKLDNSR